MEFRVLGPVEVRVAGQPVDAGHARQRAVLAVLVLDLGHVVPAELLIDRVWDENPPASVRNVLHGHLARLRAALANADDPGVSLSRQQGGYLLRCVPELVDLFGFRRLAAEAASADDEHAVSLLGEALALWHGPALAGLHSPWLDAMRQSLEMERTAAGLNLNDIRLRNGQHGALAAELAGQAADRPTDERLIGQLMLALYRSGRQADALAAYWQARRVLVEELGTDPGPELQQLHLQILTADPALSIADPATPAARAAGQAPPRQLPAAVAGFTGRAAELAALTGMLDQAEAAGPGTVVISAINGTAGVGKTALAVHWAHQVASRFGDGQLYVNLRGYDPSGTPVAPEAGIRGFLDALGVPPERIPVSAEAQAGLYRSLLADRKVLIVLDNARDEQQVRPLLPASAGSLVLVTGRSLLGGLGAADGARLISLDVLSHAEAVQLLAGRLGAARAAAEPAAADQIASLCACLPLALAVATARAAARPGFSLAVLAAELGDSAGRLDALDAGDPSSSVRAVFSWSTRQLSGEAARMFGLLGIHPGPDMSAPAAASLADRGQPQARALLRELARAYLIAEHVPGRYAFHDLLRAYAAEQAHHAGSQVGRTAAAGRILDHYLHTAHAGALLLDPSRDPIILAAPRPGVVPEQLASDEQAMAWFEAEHQVLLAAITLAAESESDAYAWQIPWTMSLFLQRWGHWQQWATSQRTAVTAATVLGDMAGQAESRRSLAGACNMLGDYEQARTHLGHCLELYQQLGDSIGEADTQRILAFTAEHQGRYADALDHSQEALRLFQGLGHPGEVTTLNTVGFIHALLGNYQQGLAFCQRALALAGELGLRSEEAHTWDSLGYAEHHLGNLAKATACYQRALSLFREFGDRFNEADVLTHLGETHQAAGEFRQAGDAWQQALLIFEGLHHPEADQVRAKLASTSDHAFRNPPV